MCGSDSDSSSSAACDLLPVELLERLTDVHCHPSDDSRGPIETSHTIRSESSLHIGRLCAQSSTLGNQDITRELARANPDKVTPFFGIHPWFIHPISLLSPLSSKEAHYESLFPSSTTDPSLAPLFASLASLASPTTLSSFISTLEQNLLEHETSHVGEIGLDKAFRIPLPIHLQPAPGEGSKISKLQTPFSHQVALVEAQLDLAIRLKRHVSFHSVQSSIETVQLLQRYRDEKEGFERIHVCLHSFGGSPESIKQLQKLHHNLFFSFATIISGRSPRFLEMLRAVEEDRLLVESDFSETSQIDVQISEIVEAICSARCWTVNQCVDQLEQNWSRFLQLEPVGSGRKKKGKKERRMDELARKRGAEEDLLEE